MHSSSVRRALTVVLGLLFVATAAGCGGSEPTAAGTTSTQATRSTSQPRASTTTGTSSTTTTTAVPETTTRPKPATTTTIKNDGPVYCTGVRTADSQWELAEASVGWVTDGSGLIFGGNGRGGNWDGIQWGYSFEVADLKYVIVLGRWDDGTLNSFVQGPGVPDDNLLDEAFVADGNASAVVPASWLKKLPANAPWTVRLMIDGTEVGSCSATL